MKPIIEVKNLSKVYRLGEIGATSLREEVSRGWRKLRGLEPAKEEGEFWALKDMSFDIERGDVVGIIGKNGAGKSTLLKVISRITEPSQGSITLRGRIAALLEVGTGMHPELTGRENIYLNGTILGMRKKEIDRKLDEIIDFAGIEQHIDTPVKRYSSGMNVRLGFAVAAHLDPDIMIVDEVLAVGDLAFQNKCVEKMRQTRESGATILFVSHNMELILKLCRRGILLDKGQIMYSGDVNSVVNHYYGKSEYLEITYDRGLSDFEHIGSGEARFSSIQMESPGSDAAIYPLKPVVFNISIEATESVELDRFALYISTLSDLKLINCEASTHGKRIKLKKGINTIQIKVEQLCLNPGEYSIGLSMGHKGLDQPVDRLHNVLKLAVINEPNNEHVRTRYDGLVRAAYSVDLLA